MKLFGYEILIRRARRDESASLSHAHHELNLIYGTGKRDPYNQMACDAILELLEIFASQGHSGFSASYVTSAVTKLMKFEPLTPLTGEPDEWRDCGYEVDGKIHLQNRRFSSVFKTGDLAYHSGGRVFQEADGACFTGTGSSVPIKFPYTPKVRYIKVGADGEPLRGKSREALAEECR